MFSTLADSRLSTPAEPIVGLSVFAPASNMAGFISDNSRFPLVEVTTLRGHKFSTSIRGLVFRPTN